MLNYDTLLSDQVKKMKPSGIRKFFDLAAMMEGVISLGVGEPDFQTPWTVQLPWTVWNGNAWCTLLIPVWQICEKRSVII